MSIKLIKFGKKHVYLKMYSYDLTFCMMFLRPAYKVFLLTVMWPNL